MKIKIYFKLITAFLFFAVFPAMAQNVAVTGRIIDSENNEPLIGATVLIKGSTTGTLSDVDGKYQISTRQGDVLQFSYIGMEPMEVTVKNSTVINVSMVNLSNQLNDVVVVGYGIVKKRDLTGSISSIKSGDFLKSRPTSINQSLQGRLAGVHVTKNDGAPGGGISIKVRGANSFFSGTEPLYVIDGIPLTTGSGQETVKFGNDLSESNPLAFLDPNDIESVEVLKDGSSIAIYGSRGANGVVMITTKNGKQGEDKIKVNAQVSFSKLGKMIDVLGARDFANYQNESYINTQNINGVPVGDLPYRGNSQSDADRILGGMAPEEYQNVDNYWQNTLYQTAVSKSFSLEYSGASQNFDYVIGGSYLDQEGIIINSGYTRYNFKINLNRQVKKWLKIGSSNNFSTSLNQRQTTSTKNGDTGVVNAALYFFPTYTKETAPGGKEFSMIFNPYAYTQSLNQNKNYNFYTSNYLNATLFDGLVFRSVLAYNMSKNIGNVYLPKTIPDGAANDGYAAIGQNSWQSFTWDNLLMFNRSFDKHDVNATLGTSWQETNVYNVNTFNSGFGRDDNNGWMIGDGTKLIKPNSFKSRTAMLSYIFRAGYTYASKYNLMVTMRRDASSVFATNHKAAFFPSIGGAWTVTNEDFAKDLAILNHLKIRYSYGKSGNSGIGAYGSIPNFVGVNAPLGDGTLSGYGPDFYNPGNPDLKWESTGQHDFGIDFSLFNRFNFTLDYYDKRTTDILQNLPQPASMGIVHILSNIGDVRNTGFELALQADVLATKDFSWKFFGNISFNKNEITRLNDEDNSRIVPMEPFVLEKGHPIGQLYGYIEEGIWGTRDEVISSAQFQKKYPTYSSADNVPATEIEIRKSWLGEIKYKDLNGDDAITATDRTYLGDVNPDFNYGFGMNFNFKKFDFSFLFDGVKGGKLINMRSLKFMNVGGYSNTTQEAYEKAWRPNVGGTNPKIAYSSARTIYYSDRLIEDASYLKLRNISLGYTLTNPIKHISAINVYFVANNLFTITKYTGYDPEVNSFGSNPVYRGVDVGGFPQSREFSIGANITF